VLEIIVSFFVAIQAFFRNWSDTASGQRTRSDCIQWWFSRWPRWHRGKTRKGC